MWIEEKTQWRTAAPEDVGKKKDKETGIASKMKQAVCKEVIGLS